MSTPKLLVRVYPNCPSTSDTPTCFRLSRKRGPAHLHRRLIPHDRLLQVRPDNNLTVHHQLVSFQPLLGQILR
jgi:hypothetical protein